MIEVLYPGIGDQYLAGPLHKTLQPDEIALVIEHVRHDDQVDIARHSKVVIHDGQGHLIQCGIVPGGSQCQRIDITGDNLGGASQGRGDRHHTGSAAKIQHPLTPHPVGLSQQEAGQHLTGGPAESPVQGVIHDAAHFFRAEIALGVVLIEQQQADTRRSGQLHFFQPGGGKNLLQMMLQAVLFGHG